jgi:hypothetical protein
MKRITVFIICVLMLMGGVGCKLDMDSTKTYMGGRMMYYGLVEILQPETLTAMEARFDKLLADTEGLFLIPPEQMMAMFNDQVVIISSEIPYTYGLLGDLTFMLDAAGAEYAADGSMIDVENIRRELFVYFSMGYRNSKVEYEARMAR